MVGGEAAPTAAADVVAGAAADRSPGPERVPARVAGHRLGGRADSLPRGQERAAVHSADGGSAPAGAGGVSGAAAGAGDWVFPGPERSAAALFDGRDSFETVAGVSPHRLRHTMRTRLGECGATPDLARVALGHWPTWDISSGYITAKLRIEAVRPPMNAEAERCAQLLGW